MTSRRALLAGLAAVALLITVLVAVRWQVVLRADRATDRDANALVRGHPLVLSIVRGVTHLGDPATVTIGAIVAAAVALALGARACAVYLLVVRGVAAVAGWALKEVVQRHRPSLAHPVAHAAGFSFPSGHALGSAAFYASVAVAAAPRLRRPVALTLAVVIPVAVAASRVLLGVHYPSDVVAGLALGWAVAIAAKPAVDRALAWRATRP